MECVFCSIVAKELPTTFLHEDEQVVAFNTRDPEAPVHFLVIPKQHISSLLELDGSQNELVGHMFYVANRIAKEQFGLEGYKAVINAGKAGGQEVFHMHLHIMGGTVLSMPKPV